MTEKKHGLIVGLWNLLNFGRRLVLNLLFLLILIALFVSLRNHGAPLAERTALVLDPKGRIVEQYTQEPAQRALSAALGQKEREVQLRDIVRAIDAAAADRRIERLVLVPDDIGAAGVTTLHEIGAAIDRFKATGKDVIAVANSLSQGQYLIAAHANRILLHPEGDLLLEGLAGYRLFYKDALDWLGVDVHLFRVGEYKSAGEPFIRNDASPQAKEADLYWMNGVWGEYLDEIAAARKLDAKEIAARIDDTPNRLKAAGGSLARLALEDKLVDQLATPDEADALLIAKGVRQGERYRRIEFQDYLGLIARETPLDTRPQIAVVVAEGEILDGDQPPGTVGGDSTSALLRQTRENRNVKAVVLRVDSPGGSGFASELIRREVELTRQAGKPVIVSMGDYAASGGYFISMSADRIFAAPTTITGSIGVFGLFMDFKKTLDTLKVHTDGVATTTLAGAMDPRRALDPRIGDMVQSMIDAFYKGFIGKVAAARNKTPEQIDQIARGRVWTGAQAKERGLVDALGGLHEALAAAADAAHLGGNYQVSYIEKPMDLWERFFVNLGNDTDERIARTLLPASLRALLATHETQDSLRLLQSMQARKIGVLAHCFCEVR